ncbi:MAG: hypothetical protein ETSY2_41575 [Candidatus Entotheonella gemina]|uniref:HTH psq-type domain-containing protein n=1 Tax=Candidatus Entotheonella gemina TaxID=1429439 RepID=W4LNY1_9BACT|nr:MAG: hypothetical protein ETSY2_41575 [Candidatus Entotheonella gemina]
MREERASKLDEHAEDISELLAQGALQKDIANLYRTTPSNLNEWMRRRGLKRQRGNAQAVAEKSP